MTGLWMDLVRFLGASLRSRTALAAENLFLRKQLALYRERQVKPQRASDATQLGMRVSPRTARRYMARQSGGGGRRATGPRWATFVRNHAQALVACDFCMAVTSTFRVLYVFVALKNGSGHHLQLNPLIL